MSSGTSMVAEAAPSMVADGLRAIGAVSGEARGTLEYALKYAASSMYICARIYAGLFCAECVRSGHGDSACGGWSRGVPKRRSCTRRCCHSSSR